MLSSKQRFHTQGAVRRVMQHGKPARSRHIVVRSIDTRSPVSRVAVIVSKKIYKSAVKRNRIRRRLFDIVRHEIAKSANVKDITIMVTSPDVLVCDHASLQREVSLALQTSMASQPAATSQR